MKYEHLDENFNTIHLYDDITSITGEQVLEAAGLLGAGCSTIGVLGSGVGIELFLVIFLWLFLEIQI